MSEVSVRRMVKDGRLEHIRIGRALRVPLISIEKIIKQTRWASELPVLQGQ